MFAKYERNMVSQPVMPLIITGAISKRMVLNQRVKIRSYQRSRKRRITMDYWLFPMRNWSMRSSKRESGRMRNKWLHDERWWSGKGIHYFKETEFEIVYKLASEFPITRICKIMDVNRSSFYKWCNRLKDPSVKTIKRSDDIRLFKECQKYLNHGYRSLNAKIWLDYRRHLLR